MYQKRENPLTLVFWIVVLIGCTIGSAYYDWQWQYSIAKQAAQDALTEQRASEARDKVSQ